MPNIVAVRDALSSQVVKRLAVAGYPPLVGGKILLGRQQQAIESAPPRIVMVPTTSPFGPVDVYSSNPRGPEGSAQRHQRSVYTEFVRFEVRCWGVSTDDPSVARDDDYDMTQALYHAFIQAMCAPAIDVLDGKGPPVLGPITAGGVAVETGQWVDATYQGSQLVAYGREFVFAIQVPTPILDRLAERAPSDVRPKISTGMTTQDGASSTGCAEV